VYQRDFALFEENGDPGEVWFGLKAQQRVIDWIVQRESTESTPSTLQNTFCVLDIGCGNGMFLHALHSKLIESISPFANYHFFGIDYSEMAISLAHKVSERCSSLKFQSIDFLDVKKMSIFYDNLMVTTTGSPSDPALFHYVLDKGSLDAMTLSSSMPLSPSDSNAPTSRLDLIITFYKESLYHVLSPTSFFILCSCNWTASELLDWFFGIVTFYCIWNIIIYCIFLIRM
jgi:EEF1A lysine methyltransferase 2